MHNLLTKSFLFLAVTSLLLAAPAYAGNGKGGAEPNKGSAPNGRPFQALRTSVADLQSQIDDLVGDVASIEDRVAGLESVVADLSELAVRLEAEFADALAQADATEAGLIALEQRVMDNRNMIALMQTELDVLAADLATKQDIIDGRCPAGTALTAIDPQGSITCTASGGNGLTNSLVSSLVVVPRGQYSERDCHSYNSGYSYCHLHRYNRPQTRTALATCPEGSVLAGGYSKYIGLTLRYEGIASAAGEPNRSWTVTAVNSSSYDRTLYATANCISFK